MDVESKDRRKVKTLVWRAAKAMATV